MFGARTVAIEVIPSSFNNFKGANKFKPIRPLAPVIKILLPFNLEKSTIIKESD